MLCVSIKRCMHDHRGLDCTGSPDNNRHHLDHQICTKLRREPSSDHLEMPPG